MSSVHRRSFLVTTVSLAGALSFARQSQANEMTATRSQPEASLGQRGAPSLNLKTIGPMQQVVSIRSLNDGYRLTMASGATASFSEFNLHFKTDSSERGPVKGRPVLLSVGMQGDRATIIFSDPSEIGASIDRR
jgi:cytochrome c